MIVHARYHAETCLADGGSAVVYRGRDAVTGQAVALKLLAERSSPLGDRELGALRRLDHPGIVRLYDCALDERTRHPFLVLELVDGADLGRLLARRGAEGRALAPRAAATIVAALLDALEAAHARGIVHRDVKPSNVLIARTGAVKLSDFGIARVPELTTLVGACGTPAYMAPEQIRHEEVDARADIYATGVLLFELLAGRRPFEGTRLEVEDGHLRREPPPLSLSLPPPPGAPKAGDDASAPATATATTTTTASASASATATATATATANPGAIALLAPIASRALAKEPAQRFPSAAAMREALAATGLVAERPAAEQCAREALGLDDPALSAHTDLSGVEGRGAGASRRRRARLAAAIGLAALVVLALGASQLRAAWPRRSGAAAAPSVRTGPATLTLRSGEALVGRVVAIAADAVEVVLADGRARSIRRAELAGVDEDPIVGVRAEDAVGVVFTTASGQRFVDALDDPRGLAGASIEIAEAATGDLVAATPFYRGERSNGLFLFDRRTGLRAPGWEAPLRLKQGSPDVPAAWSGRIDPFDREALSFRLRVHGFADLDQDGALELLVIGQHEIGMATTLLVAIEPASRRVLGTYAQYGVFSVLDLADLDGDGVLDLLAGTQWNRIELEGLPLSYNPFGAFALSGRALLGGERVLGAPGLPESPTTAHLLWALVVPFARDLEAGDPREIQLHVRQVAWLAERKQALLRLQTSSERLDGDRLVQVPVSEQPSVIDVHLAPSGQILKVAPLYDDLASPPPPMLIEAGAPTPLLRAARVVDRDGERCLQLIVPRSAWLPERR